MLPPILDRPNLVIAASLLLLVAAVAGVEPCWHGVPPRVPRRQPDRAGEHAAGHVAGEVRRDRPPGRAHPAGPAGSRGHGAAHRTGRVRRARAGRGGGRDRRRSARDRPAARRAAGRAAPGVLHAAGHERDDRSADLAPHRPHAVGDAGEHRREGVRRRPAHAAPAGRDACGTRWRACPAWSICRSSSR